MTARGAAVLRAVRRGRRRPGRGRRPHRRLRPGRHQPRVSAHAAGAGRRGRGRRADLGRCRAGLAAGRLGPVRSAAALAGRDRDQRQDHHHVDAARDAGGGRPPQPAVRQYRQPGARRAGRAGRRCWPSSCRVSNCTGRRRCGRRPAWCSMSPRTTSTGTARWPPTPRDKARVLDGRVAVVGLDDPVAAGLLNTAAAPVRVGFRLGEPAAGELGVRGRRARRQRLR